MMAVRAVHVTVLNFLGGRDAQKNPIVAAVQVIDRGVRFLDQIALRIQQFVMQGYHRILRYLHSGVFLIRPSTSVAWPRGLTPYSACVSVPRLSMMKVDRWMQVFFLPSCSFSCSTP